MPLLQYSPISRLVAGRILDVAFGPDGTRLATSGQDGTVRLWDSHTGTQLATVTQAGAPVYGVVFSPDGRLLASLAEDGTVRIDVMPIGDLVALARQRVTRGSQTTSAAATCTWITARLGNQQGREGRFVMVDEWRAALLPLTLQQRPDWCQVPVAEH